MYCIDDLLREREALLAAPQGRSEHDVVRGANDWLISGIIALARLPHPYGMKYEMQNYTEESDQVRWIFVAEYGEWSIGATFRYRKNGPLLALHLVTLVLKKKYANDLMFHLNTVRHDSVDREAFISIDHCRALATTIFLHDPTALRLYQSHRDHPL